MGRHLYHPEEDMVYACPGEECGRAGQLYERNEDSANKKGEGAVRCYECGTNWSKDEIVERPCKQPREYGEARPETPQARAAIKLDVDVDQTIAEALEEGSP